MPSAELTQLPFPIAYPLHHARDPEGALGVAERRANAIFAFYQAMRLATLLMLADYLASDKEAPPLLSHIRNLRMPHWQEWSHLADALARFWAEPGRQPRFPGVVTGWTSVSRVKRSSGGRTPDLDPVWPGLIVGFKGMGGQPAARSANDAVWEVRNCRAHREGTVTPDSLHEQEAEFARLLPLVEAAIARLFGSPGVTLLRALPLRPAEPLHVIHLAGPHLDLHFDTQPADPDWAEALAATEVAAQLGEEVLPIYPLLIPLGDPDAPGPTGLTEPVAMVDGVAEGKLTVMGVRTSTILTDRHLQAALEALRRKHADLSLDRAHTKPWTVASWARMTAAQLLEELAGRKYFPEFYLERLGVDGVLDPHAQPAGSALLLLGEAGSGKSSLLARLADRLAGGVPEDPSAPARIAGQAEDGPEAVVAYLSGRADYDGARDSSPDQLLADAVARKLGIREGGQDRAFASLADLVRHLEHAGPADLEPDRHVWLLLDGLNEAARFIDLVGALDRALPALHQAGRTRLVVSMRTGAYFSLARRDARLGTHGTAVFANAACLATFPDARGDVQPWLEVRPFREAEEGPAAYALRQRRLPARATSLPYARLSPPLRRLLLTPLYLHLFHDTWAGRADAPGDLDEGALLDAYLNRFANRSGEGVEGAEDWLDRLALVMLRERRPFLPATEAERWTTEWRAACHFSTLLSVTKLDPVEELVAASLLLRPAQSGSEPVRELLGYQFTQQKLAERVLLRKLNRDIPAEQVLPTEHVFKRWIALVAENPPFPELTGAVSTWVSRLMHIGSPDISSLLTSILTVDDDQARRRLIDAVVVASVTSKEEIGFAVLDALLWESGRYLDRDKRFLYPTWDAYERLGNHINVKTRKLILTIIFNYLRVNSSFTPDREYLFQHLATCSLSLGMVEVTTGNLAAARGSIGGEALSIREHLFESHPDDPFHKAQLAEIYYHLCKLEISDESQEVALRYFDKLCALMPDASKTSDDVATIHNDVVTVFHQSKLAASFHDGFTTRNTLEEWIASLESLISRVGESTTVLQDLAILYGEMAEGEQRQKCDDKGEAWILKCISMRERIWELELTAATYYDLMCSYEQLGRFKWATRELEQATAAFRKSIQIREHLADQDPNSYLIWRDLYRHYFFTAGLIVAELDKFDAGLTSNRRRPHPLDNIEIITWIDKGTQVRARLRRLEAEQQIEKPSLEDWEVSLLIIVGRGGARLFFANETAAAETWFVIGVRLAQLLLESDRKNVTVRRWLAELLFRQGQCKALQRDFESATMQIKVSLSIAEQSLEENPTDQDEQDAIIRCFGFLARLELERGNGEESYGWIYKAINFSLEHGWLDRIDISAKREFCSTLEDCGRMAQSEKRFMEANHCFRYILAIYDGILSASVGGNFELAELCSYCSKLGDHSLSLGDTETAKISFSKGRSLCEDIPMNQPIGFQAQRWAAHFYDRLGRTGLAVEDEKLAVASFVKVAEIVEQIACTCPNDLQAARDLVFNYDRLGEHAGKIGDQRGLHDWLTKAVLRREQVTSADEDSREREKDLCSRYGRLADIAISLQDDINASEWLTRLRTGLKPLTETNPEDLNLLRSLWSCYLSSAALEDDDTRAREFLESAILIVKHLQSVEPSNVLVMEDLSATILILSTVSESDTKKDLILQSQAILEQILSEGQMTTRTNVIRKAASDALEMLANGSSQHF